MEAFQLVILDSATDPSEGTHNQLKNFVNNQQLSKIWPESIYVLSLPSDEKPNSGRQDAATGLISRLFEAKNVMDNDGKYNFVLATSTLFKKYWERVCYSLFSPVHNWAVHGVCINDQPLDALLVVDEKGVDDVVKKFLMTVGNPDDVEILRPNTIPKDMFNAGFSTRKGGASSLAPLASLNLSYTSRKVDPVAVIDENRRRLALKAGFDPSSVQCVKVEHGNKVRVIESDFQDSPFVRYDGIVTNTPGVTLFTFGADCCLILLADTKTGACGVVHSGWMGTAKGAVRETLKAMVERYGTDPANVKAVIGPSVESQCFNILAKHAKPLTDIDPSITPPSEELPDRVNVDLVQANVMMLEQDGVLRGNVDTTWALCTKCNEELFFSHQRTGFPFGNQVGFISAEKKL